MYRTAVKAAGIVLVGIAIASLAGALAAAQEVPAVEAEAAESTPQEVSRDAAATYRYSSSGRRDPFVSLLNRGTDVRGTSRRADGPAGLLISEVSVRGIVLSRGRYVAMIQAPDNKTYVIRAGDRMHDGFVRAVMPDAVSFLQEVNDPLSLVKQREVRKLLRPMEEAK